MEISEFKQYGEALYGPRFQMEMARQLGKNGKTIRTWVAGRYPIPDWVKPVLLAKIRDKRDHLTNILSQPYISQ